MCIGIRQNFKNVHLNENHYKKFCAIQKNLAKL